MERIASCSFLYSLATSGCWVSDMRVSEDMALQLECQGSLSCPSCGVLTGAMLSPAPTPPPPPTPFSLPPP